MKMYSGLGFLVALTLGMTNPHLAGADEIDVSGNWQVNISCIGVATATSFVEIGENLVSGELTAIHGEGAGDCGTVETTDGIKEISTCLGTPGTATGQVSGTVFDLPTSGYWGNSAIFEPPFYYSLFSCDIAEIISQFRYDGTITDDGNGIGVLIDGTLSTSLLHFRRPNSTSCFYSTNMNSCPFEMRRNEVLTGSDVTVEPLAGATMTFSTVTTAGTASLTPLTDPGATVPIDFQILGSGGTPIFYDATTTASIEGAITSCIAYPDTDNDGTIDGTDPAIDENELQLLHEEGPVFVDRTLSRDPVNNVICAETSSLSQLTLGFGEVAVPVPSLSPLGMATLALALAGVMGVAAKRRR